MQTRNGLYTKNPGGIKKKSQKKQFYLLKNETERLSVYQCNEKKTKGVLPIWNPG